MYHFGKTDIGRKRKVNQDNFCICEISENVLLCAVFDGMGGHAAGDMASGIACDRFLTTVRDTLTAKLSEQSTLLELSDTQIFNVLAKAKDIANTAVYEAAHEDPSLAGMGTTLAAVLINGNDAYAMNVGDSRIYRADETGITQISRDHSYVQYLIDIGEITEEEAKTNVNKSIITRAVGTEESVEADTYTFTCDGAGILLCSDGLSNHVDNDELYCIISDCKDTEECVGALVDSANDHGGTDNITAILVRT